MFAQHLLIYDDIYNESIRKGYTKTPVVCYSTSAEAHKGYGYNKDVNEEATDDVDTDSDTSSHVEDGESQQSEDSDVSDKSGHGVEDVQSKICRLFSVVSPFAPKSYS